MTPEEKTAAKKLARNDEFRARYWAKLGLPVPPRKVGKVTQEERNARKRIQQKEARAAAAAKRGIVRPPKDASVTIKHPKGQMLGEPVITSKTKVTIATHQPDPRYHVDPSHKGEFSREWQERRA